MLYTANKTKTPQKHSAETQTPKTSTNIILTVICFTSDLLHMYVISNTVTMCSDIL